MTAKKMADIFFGKFSETISPEKERSEQSPEATSDNKGINKKIIYAVSALVLVGAILLVFL